MKKRVKRVHKHPVLNKITTVFLLLLVTAIVVGFGSIITTKHIYHQPAALFGLRMVKILTDSMEPEIRTDSYILVRNIDGMKVKEGDYVVYLPATGKWAGKGITITHECIEGPHVDPSSGRWVITTMGTNPNITEPDDPVPVENVQSVYISTIGGSGFLDFLISKWGVVVLIALPCLAGVILQIVSMVRAVKDKPDEEKVKAAVAEIEAERKAKLQQDAIDAFKAQQSVLDFLAKQKSDSTPPSSASSPQSASSDGENSEKNQNEE